MGIINKLSAAAGNTPLIKLNKTKWGFGADVYAKLEMSNPTASVKDRAVYNMLQDIALSQKAQPGAIIVEATSGNTGIALAAFCAEFGFKARIYMPESMSEERRKIMRLLGADLALTSAKDGMGGSVAAAQDFAANNKNVFLLGQFQNPANPAVHFNITGPEILSQLGCAPDILALGVGTGGTLTGAGRFLKQRNPALKIFAAEPAASPVLGGGKKGPHGIQGIGAGFVPAILDMSLIDAVLTISDAEAFEYQRALAAKEGIFAGISAGAAVCACAKIAARGEFKDKKIVTVLPDRGDRYLSIL